MDNFGILKLLSALIGNMQKNRANENSVDKYFIAPENDGKTTAKTEEKPEKAPLCNGLLKTSASHDEFVSRVFSGKKKTP